MGSSYTEKNITYDAEAKEFIRETDIRLFLSYIMPEDDMLKGDSVYLTKICYLNKWPMWRINTTLIEKG